MNLFTFSRPLSASWALSAGLAASAPVAFAQESASVAGTQLRYLSVFSQYQGFKEQPVSPWPESNATVEKIGGWRVYAKQARQPDASESMGKAAEASHEPK
jgi:hypothetical protein